MPRSSTLTAAEAALCKTLSCREAKKRFGISQAVWARARAEHGIFRSGGVAPGSTRDVVLESVKEMPHLNTKIRADRLGLRCETVHRILADAGLSRLTPRLQFAGYKVEAVRPLQVARLRRIVATRPGSYTHIDYKTFGALRGKETGSRRLGGYVVVDGFTGWSTVLLADRTSPDLAAEAVQKHQGSTPFDVRGILFSDNGPTDFTQAGFVRFALEHRFVQRTTRFNHPWSNGKVEAVNKTLKYQCFPALVSVSADGWAAVARAVDEWMHYYNHQRAHSGHINRGLPPNSLYELWNATPGDHLQRLVSLGIVRPDSEWQVRRMGSRGTLPLSDEDGLPYALVVERNGRPEFSGADEPERTRPLDRSQTRGDLMTLAK